MLENCIIYTVEVIKYYIIMKYLLGFKVRRNLVLSVLGAIVIGMFSVYVTVTEDNPMLGFLIYIFIEMFILIREKAINIVLSTCWLMIIVGMLDAMFLVVMEFVLYDMFFSYHQLGCVSTVITVMFLWLLVCVLRKKTKGEGIRIAKVYYIYFSLLTFAEGVLITAMKNIVNEEHGIKMFILIFVCMVVMILNIVMVLCLAVSNDGYKQRDALNKKYLKTQEENYLYLKERNEDIRRFRHDVKGHMLTMRGLLEKGDMENLRLYIDRVEDDIHINDRRVTVTNGVVDAILNKYLYEAERRKVNMKVEGYLFEECHIEPYDLCIIFDNIVKNAIEAASATQAKSVYIGVHRDEKFIRLYAENSSNNPVLIENGKIQTTKNDKDNHGFGLINVERSVKKYKGTVAVNMWEENKFCVDICIPLNPFN